MHGKPSDPSGKINSVLRHDYLRKSIVDRIERKNLVKHYRMSQNRLSQERARRPTKTQILRSEDS